MDTHGDEDLIGMGVALYETQSLQGVELMIEDGEVLYRLLHRLTLAGEIFCLVASICLVAEQLLGVFCHILQISQVMHVGIKARASYEICSDTNDNHHDNYCQQRLLLVERIIINLVNKPETILIVLVIFHL